MKKRVVVVISILAIIIAAVVAAIVFQRKQSDANRIDTETRESTNAIPEISVQYGEENIGKIEGYTMDMEESCMRDNIIPINQSHSVLLKISTRGNKLKAISYELKDLKEGKLIDNGEIKNWEQKKGIVSTSYEASTIMEERREYFLKFTLVTDKHEKINYYTRAMIMNEEVVPKQIAFAKKFSEDTFSEEKGVKLAAYLEPDSRYASDSLGQVTIRSSIGMLIWKTLRPERVTKVDVSVKDICIKDSGQAGTYTLTYDMKATNAQKKEEKYHVAETVTVWSFQGKTYILAYNREINQVWECNENNVGNGFIDLGIQKQSEIQHVESENGQFVAYEINGDVYVMNILSKEIRPVFQLKAKNSETLYKTQARVMKVTDNGDVDYMIYGYSPSDVHIGKNGISVMHYNWKGIVSEESVFIPCKESAQILEKKMSELCHEGDGTIYLMLSNTIYFANLKTKEWGTLIENIEDGSCVVNGTGDVIAYNTNGTRYGSDSITIVDLSNGKKQEIKEEGKKITVCGYIGDNLVYGMADASMNKKDSRFPMKVLVIVDKDLKVVKTYQQRGVTLSDVVITESVISFQRWKNNKKLEEEQLLNNTEEKKAIAKSSYYMDDVKMKELALAFTNNLDSKLTLGIGHLGKVNFHGDAEIKAEFVKEKGQKFFVYGYGKLQGIYNDLKAAESAARETYGLVVNDKGAKIWTFEENYNNE